jgi:hypothetical protein
MTFLQDDLKQAQNKFWYGHAERKFLEISEEAGVFHIDTNAVHELMNLAFYAGAKWSMKNSSELSPHIAKFIEMMILLGYLERDQL